MDYYKGNSHKLKNERSIDADRKISKVVTTDGIKKNPGAGKKIIDMFIKEDLTSIKEYAIWDVWVPAIKSGIRESLIGTVEAIFGRGAGPSTRSSGFGGSYTNYSSSPRTRSYEDRRADQLRSRSLYGFDDVILATKIDAEDVLKAINETVETYGTVSVADYYQMVGVAHEYTDTKYGWIDIIPNRIVRVRDGGYSLNLPKPMVLD